MSPKVGPGKGLGAFSKFHDVLDDRCGGNQFPDTVQSKENGCLLHAGNPFFVLASEKDRIDQIENARGQ